MPTDPGVTEQAVEQTIAVPEPNELPDPALIDFVEKGLTVDDLETREGD